MAAALQLPSLPEGRVLAIDPGPELSAYADLAGGELVEFGHVANAELLELIAEVPHVAVVIEQVTSYGMAVGCEVFETVFWSGRFAEAAIRAGADVRRLPRLAVKLHLCHNSRAKDTNVRQALIDRYGKPGTIKAPGPLYGVKADVWQALALGVTWVERQAGEGGA